MKDVAGFCIAVGRINRRLGRAYASRTPLFLQQSEVIPAQPIAQAKGAGDALSPGWGVGSCNDCQRSTVGLVCIAATFSQQSILASSQTILLEQAHVCPWMIDR